MDGSLIDWKSSETHYLYNPRVPSRWQQRFEEVKAQLPQLEAHIWVMSSGSTQLESWKWVALSKAAFLESAKAVNQCLQSHGKDIWLRALPDFHVGGLAIEARAHLSGAEVIDYPGKWDAVKAYAFILEKKISLLPLVPTQLFDLVQLQKMSPSSLRALIIGGGALSRDLYEKAKKLGYPILPSYGMTELCSQVATGLEKIKDDQLWMHLLDHVQVRINNAGLVEIQSSAMMTAYATITETDLNITNISPDAWFTTEDLGLVDGRRLAILGRSNEVVKVSGELVSLQKLRWVLSSSGANDNATVLAVPDPRRGHRIIHVYLKSFINNDFAKIHESYRQNVLPYELPLEIYFVDEIPKTELNKIKWAELKMLLGY